METVTDFIFLGSKITADGDCGHEIKRCLLFGRKAMTNLEIRILKSRDITFPTKILTVQAILFPVSQFFNQVEKYWCSSFNISLSNENSGLISFRINWLDLLAVQGTLKSLLQHHSSKASILHHSIFFRVQLSHPYMTTGKTIALTRWTVAGKVMCLLL